MFKNIFKKKRGLCITLAPFAALIITYGTLSPTFGAVAASLCQLQNQIKYIYGPKNWGMTRSIFMRSESAINKENKSPVNRKQISHKYIEREREKEIQ